MKILYSSENGDYKCNEKNILLEILIVMTIMKIMISWENDLDKALSSILLFGKGCCDWADDCIILFRNWS